VIRDADSDADSDVFAGVAIQSASPPWVFLRTRKCVIARIDRIEDTYFNSVS
jgi:hypothetical protein